MSPNENEIRLKKSFTESESNLKWKKVTNECGWVLIGGMEPGGKKSLHNVSQLENTVRIGKISDSKNAKKPTFTCFTTQII